MEKTNKSSQIQTQSESPLFQVTFKPTFTQTLYVMNLRVFARPKRYLIMLLILFLFSLLAGHTISEKPFLDFDVIGIAAFATLIGVIVWNIFLSYRYSSEKGTVEVEYSYVFYEDRFKAETALGSVEYFYSEIRAIRLAGSLLLLFPSKLLKAPWVDLKYYYQKDELIEFLKRKVSDFSYFNLLAEK